MSVSAYIGMFGVGHVKEQPRIGRVWFLGSDDIYSVSKWFARESRYWITEMMKGHDELMNRVSAENGPAIEWLKWLEFEFIKLEKGYGKNNEDFWFFKMMSMDGNSK